MSTDAHRASEPKAPETHHVESKDGASDYDNTPQFLETEGDRAKVVHADGTIDYVDTHALGGDAHEMPTGYYKSPQFIGTVVVRQDDPLTQLTCYACVVILRHSI